MIKKKFSTSICCNILLYLVIRYDSIRKSYMRYFSKYNVWATIITLILFIIPFFWFKPGVMDIGGDSSRLYFYDPLSYLKAETLYGIIPSGIGGENIGYYSIPYILLLWLVKSVVQSPTILIDVFHGISLSVGFAAVYFIVKDFLTLGNKEKSKYRELVSILSGIFYILTPTLVLGWDKEILTHNQIFLNPLMFFLLFRFITKSDLKYLLFSLIISFIFAPNFSFVAAPPFFAFYPVTILFIIIYTKLILKRKIPIKLIIVGIVLFILLQLFHLGPQFTSLFSASGQVNSDVFSAQSMYSRGLDYFIGVLPSVKVTISFLNLAQLYTIQPIDYAFIIFPFIIFLGFLWNKNKQYLLTAVFFLITFFFVTANITHVGVAFYEKLFDLPGFSMFRNFFGQWVFVFTFFYTLLFGQALEILFQKLKLRYIAVISLIIVSVLLYNAWPFLNGSLLNKVLFQSKNVKLSSKIDPEYENVLSYIRSLPIDGKFISFPLTDPGYQILSGTDGGAYQGPSTISYLTGKNDFTGYDGLIPFNDTFLTLVQNNDITGINRLFSILNIKYIFYNSDPKIYDNYFPQYPYTYVRGYMPENQKGYQAFLAKLPIHKVKDFGPYYHIYEVDNYLPHFYTADNYIYASDALTPFFVLNLHNSLRSVVYTQGETPRKNSEAIFTATNVNPLLALLDNYHLHVADPFISRRMDDIFYPLVVWNEKRTLKKLAASPNDYVDYSLLFLAKRVSELYTYQDTPITHKPFQEPKLWQVYKWKDYNSWESNLARIETQTETLINWINSAPISDSDKNTDKIKVNESLSGLQLRLRTVVDNSSYSDSDRSYLQKNIINLFAKLYQEINLSTINTSQIPYSVTIPRGSTGEYVPYLHSETGNSLDPSIYSLSIDNQIIAPVAKQAKSPLITFGPIDIKTTQENVILLYKPKNILGSEKWLGSGEVDETPSQTVLSIDSRFSSGAGFSKKIANYQPNTQYVITFDYYTEGDDVLFGVYEKQIQNGDFTTETYFNKILSSKTWKTQQSIVTSSTNATDAYIEFTTIENQYSGKLHIRNLSVVPVPNDTLLFREVVQNKTQQNLPTIQFQKINPTRYIIHVRNAVDPYTLVFSEAFSNNWKLYLPAHPPKQNNVIASYFNGEVQEEKSEDTFFNLAFLHNGKLVTPDLHTEGNGYANVWDISTSDVGNKTNYDLILVYQPQIAFYYYLAVSGITFFGVVLFTIIFLRKKNEKR